MRNFDGILDCLAHGKVMCNHFDLTITEFRLNHPDVHLSFEKPSRPCPYYVFCIDNKNHKYASFFQNVHTAKRFGKKLEGYIEVKYVGIAMMTDTGTLEFPRVTDSGSVEYS